MKHQFFTVPALHSQPAQDELNAFLAGHRILRVEKHFVSDGSNSYWAIDVIWTNAPAPIKDKPAKPKRVDYRELLDDDDFMLFSRLRELRKQIADAGGVPVYQVFTNEQLAIMVQRHTVSRTALSEIEGIGKARIDKYSQPFLDLILSESKPDETDAN